MLKDIRLLVAEDLVWFDPDAQENVVYNLGDMAWIITAMALVWIMIPGVGYFYSGLLRRKNALSMIFLGVAVLAVVSFQVRVSLHSPLKSHQINIANFIKWFFWGFSLAFSETGSAYIGDLKYFALKGVLEQPSIGSARIPSILFCVYQLMFAAITYVPD